MEPGQVVEEAAVEQNVLVVADPVRHEHQLPFDIGPGAIGLEFHVALEQHGQVQRTKGPESSQERLEEEQKLQ